MKKECSPFHTPSVRPCSPEGRSIADCVTVQETAQVGCNMTSEVVEDESQFYLKAEKYWKDVPPTVDGMLGGYGHISNIDINSSKKFLQRFLREGPNRTGTNCALDCGAGIGRITKRLLLPLFKVVDMVDVTEDFLIKAKTYLGEEGRRVRNYFCCGLQDFSPEPNSYDVIWIQWVIEHSASVAAHHPLTVIETVTQLDSSPTRENELSPIPRGNHAITSSKVTLLISTLLNSYEGARQACGPMASLSSRITWPRKV
ncbi:N-terminal Xaa-Pro-Lys N-methyltransferase 1 isoform X2 [Notamacropus eugenii]|uniref:N-terminal Xaa-Pro-Lys N-methyltransferase 1 isoform X2 n=2 Tax=Notamacropus eugenii TaxID=9315 RepID=UPI003B67B62A